MERVYVRAPELRRGEATKDGIVMPPDRDRRSLRGMYTWLFRAEPLIPMIRTPLRHARIARAPWGGLMLLPGAEATPTASAPTALAG